MKELERELRPRRRVLFICCSTACMWEEAAVIVNLYPSPRTRLNYRDQHMVTPDEDIQFSLPDRDHLWQTIHSLEFHEVRDCGNVRLDDDSQDLVQSRVRLK